MTEVLTCAFGMPWSWHRRDGAGCLFCAAETQHAIEEFNAAVAAGKYDAQGYTPAERKAQQRRAIA